MWLIGSFVLEQRLRSRALCADQEPSPGRAVPRYVSRSPMAVGMDEAYDLAALSELFDAYRG